MNEHIKKVMIPEGSTKYNDAIDVIIQSAQEKQEVEQPDKSIQIQTTIDQDILWWKTNDVNSNTFGRFAYELKEWERMARECFNYMTFGRAQILSNQIMEIAKSYRRSIDAKSSEAIRDKYNSKSTFIDKMQRNRVEKVFTQKGDAKNGLFDALIGKKKQDEFDED